MTCDGPRGQPALLDDLALDLLSVHDHLVRAPEGQVHRGLRRAPPATVPDMRTVVMNRHHQREGTEQRQRQVELEVSLLDVDDVRLEPADVAQDRPAHLELPQRLAQARLAEWEEANSLGERVANRCRFPLGNRRQTSAVRLSALAIGTHSSPKSNETIATRSAGERR